MKAEEMKIRNYSPTDYPNLKKLYQSSGWFDPETDAEDKLNAKSTRDPQSILLAFDGDDLIGTVSLIEDGRIAIFFRLIVSGRTDASQIRIELLSRAEAIFKSRGYKEAHIIAPDQDKNRQNEYKKYGFEAGRSYLWMWKKIKNTL